MPRKIKTEQLPETEAVTAVAAISDPTRETLPMLALRGLSVFPHMLLNFDVERSKSTSAIDAAVEGDRKIFLLAQKDITKETPTAHDFCKVGTVCHIKQSLKIPGGGQKILVEGLYRARFISIVDERNYFLVDAELVLKEPLKPITPRVEALMRKCVNLFDTYGSLSGNIMKEAVIAAFTMNNPGNLADYLAQNVYMRPESKQEILETFKPVKRLETMCSMLSHEIEILGIERELEDKMRRRFEGQHREHFLREQYQILQSELGIGMGGDESGELIEYREKILELDLSAEIEEKLLKDVDRLEKQQYGSSEAALLRNYLDICVELPWKKSTKERLDIVHARKILDDDHFGLDKVKQRIIEFLSVKQLKPDMKGLILCLVGPPGVGKTSVAISIAKALNRKLGRIALGGIHDEAEIRGHRKTYVGAMPGRIIEGITRSGSHNPLLLLDEIDKLGSDYRGDPSSALLEALDPEQNATFRDHYLEIPFDLSDVLFITTANTTETIPRPLLDRMEIIELGSYTDTEKLEIAKGHLIPKQRKKHGLTASKLKYSDEAILGIITGYTRESGVRLLEREIAAACRKTAFKIASGELKSVALAPEMLDEYLGPVKFTPEKVAAADEIGLVRGLAWTSAGGTTLEVEASALPGTGKVELTGNLGDVMKESARAAVSYIRSRVGTLGIPGDFYKTTDLHIHFPEGAVPKDGPSAGVTVAVAVISALTGAPVYRDIAMTGEITLRGRVLRIGGLKEKTMAALRVGAKTVIIPTENETDLEEIDQTVRKSLKFITASHIDDILDVALDFSRRQPLTAPDPASDVASSNEILPLVSGKSGRKKTQTRIRQ